MMKKQEGIEPSSTHQHILSDTSAPSFIIETNDNHNTMDPPPPLLNTNTIISSQSSQLPSSNSKINIMKRTASATTIFMNTNNNSSMTSGRAKYEKIVRKYYYQLVVGCQDPDCNFKLCFSCPKGPKLTKDAAAMMSMQLASKSKQFFCARIPDEPDVSSMHSIHSPSQTSPQRFISPIGTPKMAKKTLFSNNNNPSSSFKHVGSINTHSGAASSYSDFNYSSNDDDHQISSNHSSPSLQPQSKPFLHQLLSSSPFASLFGSTDSINDLSTSSKTHFSKQFDHQENISTENIISSGLKNIYGFGNSSLSDHEYYPQPDAFIKRNSYSNRSSFLGLEKQLLPKSDPQDGSENLKPIKNDIDNPDQYIDEELVEHTSQMKISKSITNVNPAIQFNYLTLSRVEELVTNARTSEMHHLQNLLNTIKFVFSSSESLNKSFLEEERKSHPSGLDIPSIRFAYIRLLSLTAIPDQICRTLMNAVEVLLAKLQINLSRVHDAPSRFHRHFIIILENPLLYDQPSNDGMLKKFILTCGNLHSYAKKTLIDWFSAYDMMGFSKTVDLFQNFISSHSASKDEEGTLAGLKLLSFLYKANYKNRSFDLLVPLDRFYNESLTKKINFKEEYKNWRRLLRHDCSKSKQPSSSNEPLGNSPTSFSYFQYPFLFDPVAKTRILHIDAMVQMSQEFEEAFVNQALVVHAQKFLPDSTSVSDLEKNTKQATNPYLVLEVRRQFLMEDTLDQLKKKKSDLKKPFKVKFVGGGEEGMDQGGVQKEFFQVMVNLLLDPTYGMFVYDEETRLCWINGASLESLSHFELVGIILGLALYNGVMLDINFPRLMYKKLLNEKIGLADVQQAFPSLGRGLEQLLTWEDGDVADIFMRTFEISYDVYGKVVTFPLIEGGDNAMVTNENRKQYVDLYIKHLTSTSVRKQFHAFQKGFLNVVGGQALHLCRAEELELMIVGSQTTELDFTDLEKGAEYDDGYHPEHQVIQWFWSIVHEDMSFDQKKMLLNFVTASDRVPLRGLGKLTFVIQRNGPDTDRLPTALTCFGRLLLPEYASKDKLKDRIITAIENAKGFGLV